MRSWHCDSVFSAYVRLLQIFSRVCSFILVFVGMGVSNCMGWDFYLFISGSLLKI